MPCSKKHNLFWHCRRCVNILIESLPTFGASECQMRASSLTYYTLFAIVPIFALLFGVAKGFELDQWLREELTKELSEHGEILNWIYNFADTTLKETRGGLVAGVGALILCWSVVKMIGNIENAFNRVWHVDKPRTIFRKFTDYLSFLIIAPILLLAASSASMLLSNLLREIIENHQFLSCSRGFVEFAIQCMPFVLAWLLFTFVYIFLPNTRVRFSAAFFGGFIAGNIYQIVQWGYLYVQLALSRYNVIYGSFSALPLFLIWMQLNWLIVLFGVTLSYLYQNFDYESKCRKDYERSEADKRVLALNIAAIITKRFAVGKPPLTQEYIAEKLGLSNTLTSEILSRLSWQGIITPVAIEEYDSPGYIPFKPIEQMTILDFLQSYDNIFSPEPDFFKQISLSEKNIKVMAELKETIKNSPANLPIIELIK